MKKLFWMIILLGVVFFISALFAGGDMVRTISDKTGLKMEKAAEFADSLRVSTFMDRKDKEYKEKEKKILSN